MGKSVTPGLDPAWCRMKVTVSLKLDPASFRPRDYVGSYDMSVEPQKGDVLWLFPDGSAREQCFIVTNRVIRQYPVESGQGTVISIIVNKVEA